MAVSTKWAWSLSNPTNREFLVPRDTKGIAGFAILAALFLHGLLLWLVLQNTVTIHVRPPISVELVRLPRPPIVKPAVQVLPSVVIPVRPKPALPRVIIKHLAPAKPRYSPPPIHGAPANQDDGLGLGLVQPNAGTGQGSLDGFEAGVRQKIEAAKTYPPGTPGLWNECVVNYRVTVDHSGQLLRYKLFGCGNPFLDAAARAAILVASPFPVPPNFGGSTYNVFGSLIYKQQLP